MVTFDIYSQSTILLDFRTDNFIFHVNNCTFLNGSLIIIAHQLHSGKRFPILTSQCIHGTFSSVSVNLTDTPQCSVVFLHLEYLQNSVSLYFDIVNNCTSDTPIWIYIIIGIVSFLLVIGLIISALVVRRKRIQNEAELIKMTQRVRGLES